MKTKIALVIALALMASLTFTACQKNSGSTSESSSTSVAESSEEASSEAPPESEDEDLDAESQESEDISSEASDADAEAETVDISTFAAGMQEMIDAMSDLYGDALTIGVTTEGDSTLIVTYTLLNDSLGLNAENIAESMASQGASMEDLAHQMESAGIPSPAVIVKWVDVDGTELFSQEYK